MASDKTPNSPSTRDSAAALSEWQQRLIEDTNERQQNIPPQIENEYQPEAETEEAEELACGICYRTFSPEQLTVASKERFNWEASVVACPECLTELKLEMRARSSGPDLVLGLVWAVIGFVLTGGLISLAVWSIRSDNNVLFWQWLGCYFAFVPGFVIGRMVRFGVGKRHSLEQQLIAIFFTLATIILTAYIGWVADNATFYDTLANSTDHRVIFPPFDLFITNRFWTTLTNFGNWQNFFPRLGIDLGILVGLAVAFYSSEGARIYTRPFARRQN